MFGRDGWGVLQVDDGAGHLEDAVVGPGAQLQLGHGHFDQVHRLGVQWAVSLDPAAAHACVAGYPWGAAKPLLLAPAGCHHAFPDRCRGLARRAWR